MGSDESPKDDAKRTVEKLEEIVEKIKEAIGSISGYPETSVQSKRQFWVDKLQMVFLEYQTRKYRPLPTPSVYQNLQAALRHCSSSRPYYRACCLTDLAEEYINPFQEVKVDVSVAKEIIGEALKAAMEIEEKLNGSKALEEAWVRSKALANVYRVMRMVDFEKAKEVGLKLLKTVDESIIEEEKTSGKQSMLYGRALVQAVEVVSKIDAERALRIAEGIELGEERAEALIQILESYVHSLLMIGIKV